jgi:hypothetical protein
MVVVEVVVPEDEAHQVLFVVEVEEVLAVV